MLFNSLHFLLFFPLVVGAYFALPQRFRWIMLLAASYYFYGSWKVEYLILIVFSTFVAYLTGIGIAGANSSTTKRLLLSVSLLINLGILFTFKYFNFFSHSISATLQHFSIMHNLPELRFLLPVGISFYTFQVLSYTVDVYRGKIEPEKHFGIFALFVSFFPQLVAGPIERSTNLLPQLKKQFSFSYERVVSGLQLMLIGYFKKVLIADRLAIFVDQVYRSPHGYDATTLIIATYAFAFQIFCDFSGYSDIAIGSAKIMGYDLMNNFDRPYAAKSISEFWRRWHISLSTWFRDYLYFPLGGNKGSFSGWCRNISVVFVVSGLWHGANWTYVLWGGLHALYMIIERGWEKFIKKLLPSILNSVPPKLKNAVFIVFTFHLVLFAWIFFRASTITDAFSIIQNIFSMKTVDSAFVVPYAQLALSAFFLIVLEIVHHVQGQQDARSMFAGKSRALRWSLYLIIVLLLLNIRPVAPAAFIYFQF